MAWSAIGRGRILGRIGAQTITLNRRGRILGRIGAQTITLNRRGSSLRSLSTESGDPFVLWAIDKGLVNCVADSAIRFVQHVVRCEKHTGIVYKCLDMIMHHTVFESCCMDTKLKVLSTAFDQIRNYPQADPYEVFLMKIYLRSMCTDDSKNPITRDEFMSRALDVIQSYPKVGQYKVTEQTRLSDDLGFQQLDFDRLQKALYLEFKLNVPCMYDKVEDVIYLYKNQKNREDLESFRNSNLAYLFWPVQFG